MKRSIMFLIMLLPLLFSCNKEQSSGVFLSTGAAIYVQDSMGVDILESTYDIDEIRIYHVKNNEMVEYYYPNLDTPRGVKILDIYGEKVLGVSLNTENVLYPITYIKWNDTEMDTIVTSWKRTHDGLASTVDTLWYNGKRMLPDHFYGTIDNGFAIVK